MSQRTTNEEDSDGRNKKVERRPDLEDPASGTDLSYLNEFPQFSVDEGVKAGVPPPRKKSVDDDETEN